MKIDQMNALMRRFHEEADHLAWQKNRDYHPDNVAYLEILRTAWETGTTVEQDLWGRVRKQLSALRSFVIEGKTQSETPRSRMTDVANYMAIMAVWVAHKPQIITDAIDFVAGTPCELLSKDRNLPCMPSNTACDRCLFLAWLRHLQNGLALSAPSSPLTPKPPA